MIFNSIYALLYANKFFTESNACTSWKHSLRCKLGLQPGHFSLFMLAESAWYHMCFLTTLFTADVYKFLSMVVLARTCFMCRVHGILSQIVMVNFVAPSNYAICSGFVFTRSVRRFICSVAHVHADVVAFNLVTTMVIAFGSSQVWTAVLGPARGWRGDLLIGVTNNDNRKRCINYWYLLTRLKMWDRVMVQKFTTAVCSNG